MANDMFTHYDKPRIAKLCEQAGLVQRACEHYDNIDDLKRVLSRTELITPEFLVKCARAPTPRARDRAQNCAWCVCAPMRCVLMRCPLAPRAHHRRPDMVCGTSRLRRFFGTQPAETGIEMLHHLLRTNMRQNLQVVVQVAREYSEQLTPEKLIDMFEQYNSWEGLFYYLGAVLLKTEDTGVHFKYIQAAAKVGNLQEVERITREDNFYDAEQVRDFLKEARLPDQRPLINVCDRFDMVEDLTHFLYSNNMSKYIELYVQKVNPMKAPQVAGALLDADCSEDFVRALILS
eukprot:4574601-Prymnesium_polylepis.1